MLLSLVFTYHGVTLTVYTYVTFVDCLKDIGLLGKRRNETNVFASVNKFEQAANVREYKKRVIMRF